MMAIFSLFYTLITDADAGLRFRHAADYWLMPFFFAFRFFFRDFFAAAAIIIAIRFHYFAAMPLMSFSSPDC